MSEQCKGAAISRFIEKDRADTIPFLFSSVFCLCISLFCSACLHSYSTVSFSDNETCRIVIAKTEAKPSVLEALLLFPARSLSHQRGNVWLVQLCQDHGPILIGETVAIANKPNVLFRKWCKQSLNIFSVISKHTWFWFLLFPFLGGLVKTATGRRDVWRVACFSQSEA